MQTTISELDKATKRKICSEFKKHGEFAWRFKHGTNNVNKHWRFESFQRAYGYAYEHLTCLIREPRGLSPKHEFRQYLNWRNEARERIDNIRKYTKVLPLP